MWVTACHSDGCSVLYGTSVDGQSWTVYDQNPINGESRTTSYATVLSVGETNYLFYHASGGIYLATTRMPIPEYPIGDLTIVLALPILLLILHPRLRRASLDHDDEHPKFFSMRRLGFSSRV